MVVIHELWCYISYATNKMNVLKMFFKFQAITITVFSTINLKLSHWSLTSSNVIPIPRHFRQNHMHEYIFFDFSHFSYKSDKTTSSLKEQWAINSRLMWSVEMVQISGTRSWLNIILMHIKNGIMPNIQRGVNLKMSEYIICSNIS